MPKHQIPICDFLNAVIALVLDGAALRRRAA
jgi:hypothetical protein